MDEPGKFIFIIHADSMDEMREFLSANWKDATPKRFPWMAKPGNISRKRQKALRS